MSEYDSTIHCTWSTPTPRSRCITGRATLTTVPSRNAMLDPRTATMSDHRALLLDDAQGLRTDGGTLASNTRQLRRGHDARARAPGTLANGRTAASRRGHVA